MFSQLPAIATNEVIIDEQCMLDNEVMATKLEF